MLAAIEWSQIEAAGAFVVGAILATIATIRIFRVAAGALRDERRKDRGD